MGADSEENVATFDAMKLCALRGFELLVAGGPSAKFGPRPENAQLPVSVLTEAKLRKSEVTTIPLGFEIVW